MYLYAPGQSFAHSIGGQAVLVADIPNLRFELLEAKTDGKSGAFKSMSLSEPVYQPASELSDDVPLVGYRVAFPLPAYPSDLKETVGAYQVYTSGLALDVWIQRSRANMTHLCHTKPAPGQAKQVKPLYRIEIGLSLRYTLKVDNEVWTRTADPKTKILSSWQKTRIDEGKAVSRMQGVYWSNPYSLVHLIDSTPCIDIPDGQSRDTWFVEAHEVVRTFALPYLPGVSLASNGNA